jgi:hypothetical protein
VFEEELDAGQDPLVTRFVEIVKDRHHRTG